MAKRRRQTTGLPRKRVTPAAAEKSGSEYVSRAERETRLQRWVLIGTGVTIALVVLILVGATVLELLVTPNSAAARVAGETITIAQFQERARLERAILNTRINNYISLLSASGLDANQFTGQEPLRGWLAQVQNSDQLGTAVIDLMIEDVLVRQAAGQRGLSVDQAQIDAQIEEFLGLQPPSQEPAVADEPRPTLVPAATRTPFVSPTPRPQPTATLAPTVTLTPDAPQPTATLSVTVDATPLYTPVPPTATPTFDEVLAQQAELRDSILANLTRSARITDERLNTFFEGLALRAALAEDLTVIVDSLPHVNARHILVETGQVAEDLLAALADGESFAALARANSLDTASGNNGGELGWAPAGNYVRPFADALLSAEPGATVGPVQSEFGWHIIQLRARETRPAGAAQLDTARETEFRNWLEDQRAAQADTIEITDNWVAQVPDDPILIAAGQSGA